MTNSSPRHRSLALLSAAGVMLLLAPPAEAKNTLTCSAMPQLVERYYSNHVSHRAASQTVEDRVVDLYVKRLDAAKSILLESETQSIRLRIRRAIDELKDGRCDALDAIQRDRMRWHQEMETHVRGVLAAKDFALDASIELQVDADDRTRPRTVAERTALRRKLIHFQLANYVSAGTALDEAKEKLLHRYELITRRVAELDGGDVYSIFLDAFANALDPHTSYFSAENLEDFRIGMELSLEGIGAVLSSREGYTIVQEVVPGGAADREGTLAAKDRIIAVAQGTDGEPVDVIDMALRDVVRLIRGTKDTKVTLTVLRKGDKAETLKFSIVRDKIDLKEQAARIRYESRTVNGRELKLGLIELPSFYGGRGPGARQCTADVRRLLREARAQKVDGVMLDISRNGGGLLQHAVEISGLFIRKGPVVAVKGRRTSKQVLEDEDEDILWDGPLVVLTSRVSASASEILSGAVKDYGRGIVVGDGHTFGKGTVQNIINLAPGFGALKVTTALFFRPGGASTQNVGVESDIVLPSVLAQDDFGESSQDYALPADTIDAFRGDEVNAAPPAQGWKRVTPELIGELRTRSTTRVTANSEFDEVRDKIAKVDKNRDVIHLAELLEDTDDKEEDDEDDDKTKELSPHAQEALHILADLVVVQDIGTLPPVTATTPEADHKAATP